MGWSKLLACVLVVVCTTAVVGADPEDANLENLAHKHFFSGDFSEELVVLQQLRQRALDHPSKLYLPQRGLRGYDLRIALANKLATSDQPTQEAERRARKRAEAAELFLKEGNYHKSVEFAVDALTLHERLFEDDVFALGLCGHIARLLCLFDRGEEAREWYSKCLFLTELLYGKDHKDYAVAAGNAALADILLKDFDSARSKLRDARRVIEANSGEEQPLNAVLLYADAVMNNAEGKYAEARRCAKEAKAVLLFNYVFDLAVACEAELALSYVGEKKNVQALEVFSHWNDTCVKKGSYGWLSPMSSRELYTSTLVTLVKQAKLEPSADELDKLEAHLAGLRADIKRNGTDPKLNVRPKR